MRTFCMVMTAFHTGLIGFLFGEAVFAGTDSMGVIAVAINVLAAAVWFNNASNAR